MKKAVLLSLVFSFFLVGCSSKENTKIVFEDRYLCIEQKKLDKREPVQIRVHDEDLKVAREYKAVIDSSFEFYEKQVDRNNKFCEDIKKINESEGK